MHDISYLVVPVRAPGMSLKTGTTGTAAESQPRTGHRLHLSRPLPGSAMAFLRSGETGWLACRRWRARRWSAQTAGSNLSATPAGSSDSRGTTPQRRDGTPPASSGCIRKSPRSGSTTPGSYGCFAATMSSRSVQRRRGSEREAVPLKATSGGHGPLASCCGSFARTGKTWVLPERKRMRVGAAQQSAS